MRKVLSFKEFRSVVSPHVSFEGQKNAAKEAVGSISRKLTNSDVEHTLLLQDAAVFSGEYETEDKAKASVNEYHAKSLRQGTGHRKFAWQVYYYLHRQYPNSESLGQFDRTLFEGMTFSEYFGYSVNDRPEDYEVLPRGPSTPDQHKQLGRTRRAHELVLSLDVVEGSSHYTKQLTAFLGRESEMEELQIFRDSKGAAFLWIQLAGEAGQGKSRLAFEFSTISQADGWHSGFLQTDELSRFAEYCEDWLPEAPTLIFVDYVLGKERDIQKLVRSFARSSPNFSNPVRLVLIERQRWDRGNLAMIALSDDGTNDSSARTSSSGLASWYLAMCERRHDGLDPDFTSTRYEKDNGVVELTGLATPDLVQIVRQVSGQHVCAERYSDEDIQGLMQKVDQSGRPLYAHLLGDSLRDGGSNPVTKDELLTQNLNRERQTRWRQRFRSEPPKLGIDQTCQKLAILASMLGGYDISSSLWPKEFGELTQTACEEALALVDAPVGDGIQPISAIPPMQPDLLREWFVLSSLAIKHHDFDQLTQFAWSANNEAMAAFLSRCVQDFFDHPVIQKLVEGVPNDCSWIIHDLGFKCHPISVGLPSGLRFETIIGGEITYSFDGFDPDSESTVVSADEAQKAAFWYSIAAKLDYAPSIHNLAYLCWTGQGVERDQRQAFDLYVKAAELGHPESMEIVADFLEFGVWGEPDIQNAATLYEGAARQGQPEAAYRLGLLLLKGTGIDQDIQRALELVEQASSVGHSKAKIQLGLLHLNGVGVPKDREKAFQLVCEAVDLGSTWAMRELGALYQNGLGISPNPRRGTALIRLAAIRGFQTAELDLGICYRDGIGVKRNLRRAHWCFELCNRFVNRRLAGEALLLSAEMFEQGVGFADEPDFRQAFNRRYHAARAGNQFARQMIGIHDFSDRSYGRFDRKGYGRYYDDEPFAILRRCAAQGNSQAMYIVGQLYSHGVFYRKNHATALAWYLLSGKRGSLDGQYAVARCLHMGIGSPVQKFSALIWAQFAANGGHSEAVRFVQSRKKEAPISYFLAASGVRSLRMASKLVRKFVVSS